MNQHQKQKQIPFNLRNKLSRFFDENYHQISKQTSQFPSKTISYNLFINISITLLTLFRKPVTISTEIEH